MILATVSLLQTTEPLPFEVQTLRTLTRPIEEEKGLSQLGPFGTIGSGHASRPGRIEVL